MVWFGEVWCGLVGFGRGPVWYGEADENKLKFLFQS